MVQSSRHLIKGFVLAILQSIKNTPRCLVVFALIVITLNDTIIILMLDKIKSCMPYLISTENISCRRIKIMMVRDKGVIKINCGSA